MKSKPSEEQLLKGELAKSAQIRSIRSKMIAAMQELGSKGDLKALVKELMSETIGDNIAKQAVP